VPALTSDSERKVAYTTISPSTLHVSLFTLHLCSLFVLEFYKVVFHVLVHDVEEVVIRVERRTSADAPIQRKGPEFDELIKNVSFSGNAFLTCSLLFFNGKKSTVNRALGGSTYPG